MNSGVRILTGDAPMELASRTTSAASTSMPRGSLVAGRVFAEINPGIPDGFRLDVAGNLWGVGGRRRPLFCAGREPARQNHDSGNCSQCLFRRHSAQPPVHHRRQLALRCLSQYDRASVLVREGSRHATRSRCARLVQASQECIPGINSCCKSTCRAVRCRIVDSMRLRTRSNACAEAIAVEGESEALLQELVGAHFPDHWYINVRDRAGSR